MSESKRKSFKEEKDTSLESDHYDNKKLKKNDDSAAKAQPIKTNKIQLKLGTSLSSKKPSLPKNDTTESADSKSQAVFHVSKMPTGNLAPSKKDAPVLVKKVSDKVASVFGSDSDDDEPEEMPLEAKMKMRNLGKNTPTSQGPNSYGKTKLGFCDTKMLFEKQLKEKADELLRQEEEERLSGKKGFKKV